MHNNTHTLTHTCSRTQHVHAHMQTLGLSERISLFEFEKINMNLTAKLPVECKKTKKTKNKTLI